jgi:hypothetical protein
MKELLEGLRGPALGLAIMIIGLAGIIVTAAFAALVAQMGLLLRLRPHENQQSRSETTLPNRHPSRSVSFRRYRLKSQRLKKLPMRDGD